MHGKVLVITGARGALGQVIVEVAQARGAHVAGIDHVPLQTPTTADRIDIGVFVTAGSESDARARQGELLAAVDALSGDPPWWVPDPAGRS